MKYILTLFSALILFSSCLKDTKSEHKYSLVATFDYVGLAMNDSTFFTSHKNGGYAWGDLFFRHQVSTNDKVHLGGFALSNMQPRLSKTESLPINLYRQYGTKGDRPNVYSVFKIDEEPIHMPKEHILFTSKQVGICTPVGLYFANSEKVVEEVKATFEEGDSLTVKATGYLNDVETGFVKFNLAKYTAAKDSIVSKWTPVKLEKLGEVDRINFDIISTKPVQSKAFCIDNFVASIYISY